MIEKIESVEPTSNLVEFRRGKRIPTMQVKPTDYLACKHPRTLIRVITYLLNHVCSARL